MYFRYKKKKKKKLHLTDVRYFDVCKNVAAVGAAHNVVARTVGAQIVCQVTLYMMNKYEEAILSYQKAL